MTDAAEHLTAFGENFLARLLLQIFAKGVIRGDEEPRLAALLQEATRDAVPHRPGIVSPVYGIGRAFRASQQSSAGARADEDLVLVARNIGNRERNGRIRHVDDHVDTFGIEPAPGHLRADAGLVPM